MTALDAIPDVIDRVRDGFREGVVLTIEARRAQLQQLRRLLVEQELAIATALNADLGKSAIEAHTTEIGFTIKEIDHTLDHLDAWSKSTRVWIPMYLRGIFTIGVIGLVSDFIFKWVNQKLYPWAF